MTAPETRQDGPTETGLVLLVDFRAAADGPGKVDPASVGERTLHELQRRASETIASALPRNGSPFGEWQILNFERLLVVDDAGGFSEHGEAYRLLLEAPTCGRMLCLVVGAPAESRYLDVPKSVGVRVPVLWVGDSCGVGWQVGWATTTRLAFSGADPDGTMTVANLIESLTAPEVFDQTASAIDGLPEHTGAVAVLPWVRWSLVSDSPHEPGNERDDGQPDDPVAHVAPRDDFAPSPRRREGWRVRRSAMAVLIMLIFAVICLTATLAVEVSRRSVGYIAVVVAVGVILLVLLAIASRQPPIVAARPAPIRAEPGPPARPEMPGASATGLPPPVSANILDHARWMMGATAADESFRQLNSPEQLVMLGGELDLVKLVRFAPDSTRQLLDPFADDEDVAWTTSGNQVGIIRLAPLKGGLVRPRDPD